MHRGDYEPVNFQTYRQALRYLYDQLPMFHRVGPAAYKANLDNTIAICGMLGNPQNDFRTVHIAGTNGKGSTSHLLAAILQCAGYRTGLYTSPHLSDFRERIRINGKMMPEKNVVEFVNRHKHTFEKIKPSFFEMTVGLAFDHFSKKKVDIAVIETGLGGRLDSTNIVTPLLSVITTVSRDHTALLGNTLEKIAVEKAGIIKPGVPVVTGELTGAAKKAVARKAAQERSDLHIAPGIFTIKFIRSRPGMLEVSVKKNGKIFLPRLYCGLAGQYQLKNISTVLQAVEVLRAAGFQISDRHILEGFKKVRELTGLRGRWEMLSRRPLVICDVGHNEEGIREVVKQIRATPHRKLHMVLGMVADKEIRTILKLLPRDAACYFCQPNLPRALDKEELAAEAGKAGLSGKTYASVKKAFEAAKRAAGKNDLVFVGGSTFVVAEVV